MCGGWGGVLGGVVWRVVWCVGWCGVAGGLVFMKYCCFYRRGTETEREEGFPHLGSQKGLQPLLVVWCGV